MRPRQYLSWSSMDLFERNPERWKQVYIYGREYRINSGQAFGKKMADGLEKDEATGDIVLDLVIDRLPKFELMDRVIEDENGEEVDFAGKKFMVPAMKYKDGKETKTIPLLAKLDTAKTDLSAFKEYKTGQEPWTFKKVHESGQITFYATVIFIKTGKIPQDIELVQAMTEKDRGEITMFDAAKIIASGDIRRFPTRRTTGQVLNMMLRIKNRWEDMQKVTEKELF